MPEQKHSKERSKSRSTKSRGDVDRSSKSRGSKLSSAARSRPPRESRDDGATKSRARSRRRDDDTKRSSPPTTHRSKSRGPESKARKSSPSRARSRGRDADASKQPTPTPPSRAKSRERGATGPTSPPTRSRSKSRGRESRERKSSPSHINSRGRSKSLGRDVSRHLSPTTSSRAKKVLKHGDTVPTSPPPRHRSEKKSRGEGRSKHSSPLPEKSSSRPSREKSTPPPLHSDKKKPEPSAEPDPETSVPDLDAFVFAFGDDVVKSARDELFNFDGIVAGVSTARENVAKFASEHPELGPAALANKWLDFVETYIMPPVKRAGLFPDDTTCFTGTTGWETCDTTVEVEVPNDGTKPKLLDLVRDSTNTSEKSQKKTPLIKSPRPSMPSMPMIKKGTKGFLKSLPVKGPMGKGQKKRIDDEGTDDVESAVSVETFEL